MVHILGCPQTPSEASRNSQAIWDKKITMTDLTLLKKSPISGRMNWSRSVPHVVGTGFPPDWLFDQGHSMWIQLLVEAIKLKLFNVLWWVVICTFLLPAVPASTWYTIEVFVNSKLPFFALPVLVYSRSLSRHRTGRDRANKHAWRGFVYEIPIDIVI